MESSTLEVIRRYVKYVFLDVVRFSERSAEAQSEIVIKLNEIVRQALDSHNVKRDGDLVLIPTGDGMCIALLSHDLPYDVHIQFALTVLSLVAQNKESTQEDSRRFEVR